MKMTGWIGRRCRRRVWSVDEIDGWGASGTMSISDAQVHAGKLVYGLLAGSGVQADLTP